VSTTHPLRTMLDRLLDPWPLKIDWAERVKDCTEECNTWKTYLTVPEIRHFECYCPSHIEYRQTYPMQSAILTQLFEAKYEVPATGNNGKGATKLEAPLPGNLVVPDTLMWNIRTMADALVGDWSISWRIDWAMRYGEEAALQALRAAQGRRLPEELDDAAKALEASYGAAMRYLGYDTDRVMLVDTACDACGGVLSAPRELGQGSVEVRCEGFNAEPPCGRTYSPAEWLATHRSASEATRTPNGQKTHCPRHHVYDDFNTRISTDGKRRCRTCEAERRMLRSSKR